MGNPVLCNGMNLRSIRLITGLVLFIYVATHLLNHALGLISLDAMETGRVWFLAAWRNFLGSMLLYGALVTHLSLAFHALYQRQHLRMPLSEALQLVFGLTIPMMLITHVVGTRVAHELLAVTDSYTAVVLGLWNGDPWSGARQVFMLIIAWLHGCIGFNFWLRMRPWYAKTRGYFCAGAFLLALLALLGFAETGKEITELIARQPRWLEQTLQDTHAARGKNRARLIALREERRSWPLFHLSSAYPVERAVLASGYRNGT